MFCVFLRGPALTGLQGTMLTYDRIGLAEGRVWDVETHGGGGFQVDPQETLGGLHQEVARLFPFENLVYQPGRLPPLVGLVRAIGEEHIDCLRPWYEREQPFHSLGGTIDDLHTGYVATRVAYTLSNSCLDRIHD